MKNYPLRNFDVFLYPFEKIEEDNFYAVVSISLRQTVMKYGTNAIATFRYVIFEATSELHDFKPQNRYEKDIALSELRKSLYWDCSFDYTFDVFQKCNTKERTMILAHAMAKDIEVFLTSFGAIVEKRTKEEREDITKEDVG